MSAILLVVAACVVVGVAALVSRRGLRPSLDKRQRRSDPHWGDLPPDQTAP